MLVLEIPGHDTLNLEHLVLDYNGTLAVDGKLLEGVAPRLEALGALLAIRIVTADTFGQAAEQFTGLPVEVLVLPAANQPAAKRDVVRRLNAPRVVAIGNGRNDVEMLAEAALGIAVIQEEGVSTQAVLAADVLTPNICAALDLLLHPPRLAATLRI